MQSAAQWEVVRSGAGTERGRERGQPLAAELVEWKSAGALLAEPAPAGERADRGVAGDIWQAVKRELAAAQGEIQRLRQQVAVLQQENEGLRRENKELLQSPFKKRSEKSEKSPSAGEDGSDGGEGEPGSEPAAGGSPGGERRRGGQPGGAPHPRVDRSGLEVRDEVREPAGGCACPDCGRPYSRNGEEVSERIEVEVKGHVRRIRRPRYRATCECPPPPDRAGAEVIAPLEPALFRGTSYGLSVWVTWLIQVYWQRRPAHRQEALFVQGDETSWVVHVWGEAGENRRGWLWVCLSADAVRFRVDRSRSAEAAGKLFGQLGQEREMVLVCDRYSANVKLARVSPGQFVLAICRAHCRRDYVKVGRSRPDLQEWVDGILERIGTLYRLNAERMAAWDPHRTFAKQAEGFQAMHRRLQAACDALFARGQREVAALTAAAEPESPPDPRLGPLQSMLNHRAGLEVFLSKPYVPMDNNSAERALRRPVIGRKLSFGSHSEDGAALQGLLLSVFATLDMAGLGLWRWLEEFPGECAAIGSRAVVVDPRAWLPWGLSAERRARLQAPGGRARDGPGP